MHPVIERLTTRQRECLELAARHWTIRDIARQLGISPKTVERHLEEAIRKMGVADKAAAVRAFIKYTAEVAATSVYISSASADLPTANMIRDLLESQGYNAPLGNLDIYRDATDRVINGFARSEASDRIFVALLSPAYVVSSACKDEWSAANSPASANLIRVVAFMVEATIGIASLSPRPRSISLIDLELRKFNHAVLEAIDPERFALMPVEIQSPTRLGWSENLNISVIEPERPDNPAAWVSTDFVRQTIAVTKLGERIRDFVSAPTFNGSRQYAEQMRCYLEDLPTDGCDGNFYLCDASARTLTEMFRIEADILPTAFAAQLRSFLESHIALRAFYPEMAEFYASIRTGVIPEALPMDAVEAVRSVLDALTPGQFDPSVTRSLAKAVASAPVIDHIDIYPGGEASPSSVQPPADPFGRLNRVSARDQLVARSINGLWKVFLAGKELASSVEGWRKAYTALKPTLKPIIDYLRQTLAL